MKIFIIALLIVVMVISCATTFVWILHSITTELMGYSQQINEAIIAEDSDAAGRLLNEMEEAWKRKKVFVTTMVDHATLTALETTIAKLHSNIDYKELARAAENNARLQKQLESIVDNEYLRIENVL